VILDPWTEIRKKICFGNEEPKIELVAITTPIGSYNHEDPKGDIECIPAIAAGTSYNKEATSIEKAKALNKKLIKMGHNVPLESLTYNFYVTGLSKAAGAQWSRHRIGAGHVSLSRRYTQQQPKFVYPTLNYIKNKDEVEATYKLMSGACENAYRAYKFLIDTGAKKQDARLIMPVNVATTRNAWANARALRDFFRLRLDPAAEEEIRRLAFILLDIVFTATPSLFEDIVEKFKK
jgi:thymidylate synthase (FAD)